MIRDEFYKSDKYKKISESIIRELLYIGHNCYLHVRKIHDSKTVVPKMIVGLTFIKSPYDAI